MNDWAAAQPPPHMHGTIMCLVFRCTSCTLLALALLPKESNLSCGHSLGLGGWRRPTPTCGINRWTDAIKVRRSRAVMMRLLELLIRSIFPCPDSFHFSPAALKPFILVDYDFTIFLKSASTRVGAADEHQLNFHCGGPHIGRAKTDRGLAPAMGPSRLHGLQI